MLRHARPDYIVNSGEKLHVFQRDRSRQDCEALGFFESESVAYRHIFGERSPAELPDEDALKALGAEMMANPAASDADGDVPAGYTYFGQFVFHDITALVPGRTDPTDWENGRTPSLDLDSVMPGLKPADDPKLGVTDGLFSIGTTSGDINIQEDLPRIPQDAVGEGTPLIADMRNDDFLPLAQTHLLLLKFYNAIAKGRGYDGSERDEGWWRETRKIWVQHFQSVVLRDYLPRIVDDATYREVLDHGRRIVRPDGAACQRDWFPLEFAGAVGRFGHSMIRNGYQPWNSEQDWQETDVDHFIEFSYLNSGDGLRKFNCRVPGIWATNWLVLFDFAGSAYQGPIPTPMMSAPIDSRMASKLFTLPDCLPKEICRGEPNRALNLATATLLRGRELGLASAQQALDAVDEMLGAKLPRLSREELLPAEYRLDEPVRRQLTEATPLWFYILREAESPRFGQGRRLGPLGGRIVMETLHAAIAASADSILADPDRRPSLPSANADRFTMPDLILYSAVPNPLG